MTHLECDAILFDLDGVLIDSTTCITRHWQVWGEKHHLDLEKIMSVAHGRPTLETMRLVAPHLPVEAEARRFAEAEALDNNGVLKIEGAARLLKALPPDAWAIVTSGTRNVAAARLTYTGLPIPTTFITADDVSRGKPSPEPYLLAAQELGLTPNQCLVIEDSPAGIEAAHSAGMRAIAVTSTHAHAELVQAEAIAEQLTKIQVEGNGRSHRLAIRIE